MSKPLVTSSCNPSNVKDMEGVLPSLSHLHEVWAAGVGGGRAGVGHDRHHRPAGRAAASWPRPGGVRPGERPILE